jgi:hypothetical protein
MAAKLSVIELPGQLGSDDQPFALVLSGCDGATPAELDAARLLDFRDACGARAILVTGFPIEVS